MPFNMFFIKICIFDHSSQLAFLLKSIACSRDICNPKYDNHSFLSFYAKFIPSVVVEERIVLLVKISATVSH